MVDGGDTHQQKLRCFAITKRKSARRSAAQPSSKPRRVECDVRRGRYEVAGVGAVLFDRFCSKVATGAAIRRRSNGHAVPKRRPQQSLASSGEDDVVLEFLRKFGGA